MGTRILISLFLLRVLASLVGCYFNLYYYPFSDTLIFHKEGIIEFDLLFKNPADYFTSIFSDSHHNNYSGLMSTSQSFWNDTRSNLIIKMLSIFDLFSGKNFFINTLFFNFLIFFGPVALYKVFIGIFPKAKYALIIGIFLLPSALYFSSMIHRDGLILLAISMVVYHFYFLMNSVHFSWKRIVAIILFLLIIFLLRNFVLLTMIPALIAWMIANKKPKYVGRIFIGIYAFAALVFFGSGYISPKTDVMKFVSERQLAFIEIAKTGSSKINVNPLYPNFRSFLNNAPQAINHSLMRPYITELGNMNYIPFSIEIFFYEIFILLFLFYRKRGIPIHPLAYFCIFFSLSMFLVIGYTIPILGAIVRYRSIYFIFLMIPFLGYMDWPKIGKKLNINLKVM
ncbi:MAG: hypothetical protein ABIP35_03825 [Ginsengibacter sp.]